MSNHQAIKRRACCIQSKSSVQKSGMVTRSDHAGRPFCMSCLLTLSMPNTSFFHTFLATFKMHQVAPTNLSEEHRSPGQASTASGEAAAASLWDAQVVSNSMIWFKLIWYIYIYIVYPGRKSGGLAMACLHRIEFDWALHQFAAKERRG